MKKIIWIIVTVCVFKQVFLSNKKERIYSSSYVMKYEGSIEEAIEYGKTLDLTFKRRVLKDFYEFERPDIEPKSTQKNDYDLAKLRRADRKLKSLEQEEIRFHTKRAVTINDANWTDQWHLQTSQTPNLNVYDAWDAGYSGSGVTIAILDDGIDANHSDLTYNASLSYDYIYMVADPSHAYPDEGHGTSCAGVAAADKNSLCVIGTAYDAQLAVVRILDNYVGITASKEAEALTHELDYVDIYSNSWGPSDDGVGFDKLPAVVDAALQTGIEEGRGGKGAIYTWAAGNGGWYDNCNADGYANNQYTIAIAATSESTSYTWYSEQCPAILASTYSGDYPNGQITTTGNNDTCIGDFSGTSSACPLASGIIALTLEANSNLTWRDVQYIIVQTSTSSGLHSNASFYTNAAGYDVSHYFGFGLLDADAMVTAASTWTTVPQRAYCSSFSDSYRSFYGGTRNTFVYLDSCYVEYVEHVLVTVDYEVDEWLGDVELNLTSNAGTSTTILGTRWYDDSYGRYTMTFMSVHNWGEDPRGTWILTLSDMEYYNHIELYKWKLEVYGTVTDPSLGVPSDGTLGGYCDVSSNCSSITDGGCMYYNVCVECTYNFMVIGDYCRENGALGGYCNSSITCESFDEVLECIKHVCKIKEETDETNVALIIGIVVGCVVGVVVIVVVIIIVAKVVAKGGKAGATVAPSAAANSSAPSSTIAHTNVGFYGYNGTHTSYPSQPPGSTNFVAPPAYSSQPPPAYQDVVRGSQLPPIQRLEPGQVPPPSVYINPI